MDDWTEVLLRPYSMLGLDSWIDAEDDLKRRATAMLEGRIAREPNDVKDALEGVYKSVSGEHLRLIPAPHTHRQIEQAFFLPVFRSFDEMGHRISFELFLIVKDQDCLAYRWEPADEPTTTHAFGHVQMCRKIFNKTFQPNALLTWIPDHYPAIPLLTSDPFGMFLALVTSIHGLHEGILGIVDELLKGEPGLRSKYISHISSHFNHR